MKKEINDFDNRAKKYSSEMQWILDPNFITPLVPNPFGNKKLLDVCCGTGIISEYASKKGWQVIGVDINPNMIEECNKKECAEFIVQDILEADFADNEFEVITCRQGLHYLNIEKVLMKLKQYTNKYLILAHITAIDKEDVRFWEEYFNIAAPKRKKVFAPDELKEIGFNLGYHLKKEKIIFQEASLTGPISHMPDLIKKKLKMMLEESKDDFKSRCDLKIVDGEYYCTRRWEFLIFEKMR